MRSSVAVENHRQRRNVDTSQGEEDKAPDSVVEEYKNMPIYYIYIDGDGKNCNDVAHRLRWSETKKPSSHKDWAYLKASKEMDATKS